MVSSLPRASSLADGALAVLALVLLSTAGSAQDPQGVPAAAGEPQAPEVQERRIDSLYEGALVGAQDGAGFVETPHYRRLLELLQRYREEELRQKALERPDFFQAALADPEVWRGELVRVRGLVAGMEAVRLSRPIGDQEDVYRAYVTETDGSEGVVVDFLAQPPAIEIREDVVDVEGVFFRTVRYENLKGGVAEAPYLIARNLRRMDPASAPRVTLFDQYAKILIGAGLAFFVVRILLTLRGKKSAGDSAAARASRLIRERAARGPLGSKPAK